MAKQKLGQHFLFDKNILKKIALASKEGPSESILEIGAGMGTLTEQLLSLFKNVYAIELDSYFYNYLKDRFSDRPNLHLIHGDILKLNIDDLPVNSATGNIPYYITTPIIFKLLDAKNIEHFSLLMQLDVARRLVSPCGSKDYGILSVNVQFQADVKLAFKVKNTSFSPPPKVESAFVTFRKKKVNSELVRAMRVVTVRAFSMRRKTIFNNLKRLFGPQTEDILRELNIPANIRAERLPVDTFIKLAELFIEKERGTSESASSLNL